MYGTTPAAVSSSTSTVCPLQVVEPGQVVLERTVGSHRGGLIEGDVTGIDGDVLVLVDVVRDLLGLGLKVAPVGSAIGVELRVGEVHDLFTAELVLGLDSLRQVSGCRAWSRNIRGSRGCSGGCAWSAGDRGTRLPRSVP